MKELKKYLLTLLILMSGGYGYLYADAHQDQVKNSLAKILKKPESANFAGKTPPNGLVITSATPGAKGVDKIYSEEKEEENGKLSSPKTYISIGSYFADFDPLRSKDFFYGITRSIQLNNHWFYSSSSRFLILRVIRI